MDVPQTTAGYTAENISSAMKGAASATQSQTNNEVTGEASLVNTERLRLSASGQNGEALVRGVTDNLKVQIDNATRTITVGLSGDLASPSGV